MGQRIYLLFPDHVLDGGHRTITKEHECSVGRVSPPILGTIREMEVGIRNRSPITQSQTAGGSCSCENHVILKLRTDR